MRLSLNNKELEWTGRKINEMNHVKGGKGMVESFMALWQSHFLQFISLCKTLNGSTINCSIKEQLNLLISKRNRFDHMM